MGEETERLMHQTVKKVGEDIEQLGFNTAISQLMVFSKHLASLGTDKHGGKVEGQVPRECVEVLARLLQPFAPHLAEEMWEQLQQQQQRQDDASASYAHLSLCLTGDIWPTFDEALCTAKQVEIGVQVNGKRRASVSLRLECDEADAKEAVLALPEVERYVQAGVEGGKKIVKFIYVPGKIVNIVLK
jgi:leucyl-tRNA synthetase